MELSILFIPSVHRTSRPYSTISLVIVIEYMFPVVLFRSFSFFTFRLRPLSQRIRNCQIYQSDIRIKEGNRLTSCPKQPKVTLPRMILYSNPVLSFQGQRSSPRCERCENNKRGRASDLKVLSVRGSSRM